VNQLFEMNVTSTEASFCSRKFIQSGILFFNILRYVLDLAFGIFPVIVSESYYSDTLLILIRPFSINVKFLPSLIFVQSLDFKPGFINIS